MDLSDHCSWRKSSFSGESEVIIISILVGLVVLLACAIAAITLGMAGPAAKRRGRRRPTVFRIRRPSRDPQPSAHLAW
jgi:hypothetical protein